jgi:hypothetical protein
MMSSDSRDGIPSVFVMIFFFSDNNEEKQPAVNSKSWLTAG